MTRDQTSVHNTIVLQRFAERVARAVSRFLDVSPSLYCYGHFDSDIPIATEGPTDSGTRSELAG